MTSRSCPSPNAFQQTISEERKRNTENTMQSWKLCSWMENSVPVVGMLLAMTALSGNMIVSKKAMSNGTSFYVLSVYSNALATLVLFPCGFFLHRSNRPPLSFSVVCRIFLLASFGCLADIGSYAGINNSSPTLGSVLLNLVPGFTYILAVIFRMDTLNLRKSSDICKSLGTIISIVGASIATLYYGPSILNGPTVTMNYSTLLSSSSQQNWILGGVLLGIASFSVAAWSIVQTWILKIYPAEMIVVAIYCLFVTTQSSIVALIAEKDLNAWKLQEQMGLVAVLYAAIVNIMIKLCIMSWCLARRGPLFVSLFNPVTIVISAAIGAIFFHEVVYLGSLAGALVIVIGFYAVIWGKAKETKMKKDDELIHALLQDRIEQA